MNNIKYTKYVVGIILLLTVIWFLNFYSYRSGITEPYSLEKGEDVVFVVGKGESVKKIATNLVEKKLIKSEKYFEAYLKRSSKDDKIQAGEYVLNPSLNIREVADILAGGRSVGREREIKVIEGWNVRDMAQYFEREGMFQSDKFLELVGYPRLDYRQNTKLPALKNYKDSFPFLSDKPEYYGLEGYLFPDTYRIFKDASLDDVVRKMLANFDKKVTPEMRAEVTRQGKTLYQIVVMASVLEKEVKSEEDMKIVSGIFWRRLKNGQPFESCATLAYVLGVNKPRYTLEDTQIDSPYNTYKNPGLPPGPICNPGVKAIRAAIYPTENDYNFFLTSDEDGRTIFSKTFEEHIANKAKYLK